MSPENVKPPDDRSGDISEDELKKILGDDYDSVVGKDEETGEAPEGEPVSDGEPVKAKASAAGASPAPAPEPAEGGPESPAEDSQASPPGDEEPVTPNMTPEEAEAWAKQMEQELEADGASAQAAPSPSPDAAPAPAASAAAPAAAAAPQAGQPAVQPVQFAQLEHGGARQEGCIDVLLDVKLPISVELGRTEMLVKEILNCGPGTVIELNKLAGEPVDVLVNGRMVATGEVVVVDEHFGIRLTNLISPKDRVRSLA